jgi:hypothetical protein
VFFVVGALARVDFSLDLPKVARRSAILPSQSRSAILSEGGCVLLTVESCVFLVIFEVKQQQEA